MLDTVTVSAKIEGEEKREAKFQYDVPKTLTEALEKYTEEQVFGEFLSGFTVSLQAPARKKLRSMPPNLSAEAYSSGVQSVMNDWKLGQKAVRATTRPEELATSLLAQWASLSNERQRAILADFAKSGITGESFLGIFSAATNGEDESEDSKEEEEVEEDEEDEESSAAEVETDYSPRNARRRI